MRRRRYTDTPLHRYTVTPLHRYTVIAGLVPAISPRTGAAADGLHVAGHDVRNER
jgi:hypothetical protein